MHRVAPQNREQLQAEVQQAQTRIEDLERTLAEQGQVRPLRVIRPCRSSHPRDSQNRREPPRSRDPSFRVRGGPTGPNADSHCRLFPGIPGERVELSSL